MARLSLIPGFRFNPTDEVLVVYYLKRKILGKKIAFNAVAEVNIYDYCPWDLPDKSSLKSGDLEWYFFCPKSKKYSSGGRANRATETGFWKATGKDRTVEYKGRTVATIKTLVFHLGRAKDSERTNWVLHEYRMEDEQLAKAGIVQDTYVLCRLFEKSGAGPKNGAQYGAPFNEDEWDDDLVNSIDSQAIFGLVGSSVTADHKLKGPATTDVTEPGSSIITDSANKPTNMLDYKQQGQATTSMTEPGSSSVTLSAANERTNTQNYKQKGPATTNMIEPGSSTVMFSAKKPTSPLNYKQKVTNMNEPGSSTVMLSADEPTKTLNCKQKGLAAMNMTGPGLSTVMFSADEPTKTLNCKQKGPDTTDMTEPGSSTVVSSAHVPTKTLNYKQKGPATMNMIVPQTTHGSSVTEPGSSGVMDERPADVDMVFLEDFDLMMGVPDEEAVYGEDVKTLAPNGDDAIYDGLEDILTVEDLSTDGLEYPNPIDEWLNTVGPGLENFYVD